MQGHRNYQCERLSFEQLRLYLDDGLEDTNHAEVEAHLDRERCPICLRALEELLLDPCRDWIEESSRNVQSGETPVPEIPRYTIKRRIGKGGMGEVFLADDSDFNRDIAIKILRNEAPQGYARRFEEESRITGRLQHPGIPPVHYAGKTQDGRPFFAMKLIQGETLQVLRDCGEIDHKNYAEIFQKICETVAYAHERKVIHRDLKPENVMVGPFGELQVMDWGLAKILESQGTDPVEREPESSDDLTHIGEARPPGSWTDLGAHCGTLAYMAPEQALGELECVDTRSDVFSLGGIICFLFTGTPVYLKGPNQRRNAIECNVAEAFARLDKAEGTPELVALAKRCLSKERDERPKDAGEVARIVSEIRTSSEERARIAEIDGEKAKVEASEARKRLRVLVGLVISIVFAAGAIIYAVHQLAERARLAEDAINSGISQSRTYQQQALAEEKIGEPGAARDRVRDLWKNVDTKVQEVQRELEAIAKADLGLLYLSLPSKFREKTRRSIDESRSNMEAARRDLEVLDGLDRASYEKSRLTESDLDYSFKRFYIYAKAGAKAYEKVFRDYDIDVLNLEPAEAAKRIRGSRIGKYLVPALDDWLRVDPSSEIEPRLISVANLADDDLDRKRIRQAIAAKDRVALLKIKESPNAEKFSPETALLLALGLETPGSANDSAYVAHRALARNPGHFWLNDLAGLYDMASDPPRYPEALAAFKSALALRPKNPMVLINIGQILTLLGDHHQAVEVFSDAYDIDKGYQLSIEGLIDCLINVSDLKGAEAHSKKWLDNEPTSISAMSTRARVLNLLGRISESDRLADQVIARSTEKNFPFFPVGLRMNLMGKNEALPFLKRAVEIAPIRGEVHTALGMALYQFGGSKGIETGRAEIQKGVDLAPGSPICWAQLAECLSSLGKTEEASEAFREAIKRLPSQSSIYAAYARHLRNANNPAEAFATAREAVQRNGRDQTALLEYGYALILGGKLDDGITKMKQAVQLIPSNFQAYFLLGEAYRQYLKDTKLAIESYQAALKWAEPVDLKPFRARVCDALGKAYQANGQTNESIRAHRVAVELNPEDWVCWEGLGWELLIDRDYSGAMEAFMKAVALEPQSSRITDGIRRIYFEMKEDRTALEYAKHSVKLAPQMAWTHNELGLALGRLGRFNEALAAYREAVRLDQANAVYLSNLAETLFLTSQPKEAEAAARRAVELDPKQPGILKSAASVLAVLGLNNDAVSLLNQAVKLAPKDANAHFLRAGCLMQTGPAGWDAAIESINAAIDLLPNEPLSHSRKGFLLSYQGDNAAAESEFKTAIDIPNAPAVIHTDYAQFLAKEKRYSEALGQAKIAVQLEGSIAAHHAQLAQCYQNLGKSDEAIAAQREAAKLAPQDTATLRMLGVYLRRAGKLDEAKQALETVVRLQPLSGIAWFSLGRVFQEQGRHDKAIEILKTAEERLPNDGQGGIPFLWQLEFNLGDSLMKTGRFAEAHSAYCEAKDEALKFTRSNTIIDELQPRLNSLDADIHNAQRFVELEQLLIHVRLKRVAVSDMNLAYELFDFARGPRKAPFTAANLAANLLDEKAQNDPQTAARCLAAARAAIEAAAGIGEDSKDLEDAQRNRMRELALKWLKCPGVEPDQFKAWLDDPALGFLRDQASLEKLPEVDRNAWQGFWAELREITARSSSGPKGK